MILLSNLEKAGLVKRQVELYAIFYASFIFIFMECNYILIIT